MTATATDTPKLDEQALRKPEFAGGVPIVLCDGQAWSLPLPKVTNLYPIPDPTAGPVGFTLVTGYDLGSDYDNLIRAHASAGDAYDDATTLLALAAYLIRLNYDLAPSDFASLLRWPMAADPDGPARIEMWRAIKAVAFGQGVAEQAPEVKPTTE